MRLTSPFTLKVVGVSFTPGYPDHLLALDGLAREAESVGERLAAILIRNPDNPHDANAVEVHVPSLGDEWAMIGHVMREVAARLAPEMDEGVEWRAEVESVLINPDYPDRPGIAIRCERVERTDD